MPLRSRDLTYQRLSSYKYINYLIVIYKHYLVHASVSRLCLGKLQFGAFTKPRLFWLF